VNTVHIVASLAVLEYLAFTVLVAVPA